MWKTPLPTPQGCGQPRVAGCRGLHTCETLTRFVMDNPSGYPHAACQTAIEIFNDKSPNTNTFAFGKANGDHRGMPRGGGSGDTISNGTK